MHEQQAIVAPCGPVPFGLGHQVASDGWLRHGGPRAQILTRKWQELLRQHPPAKERFREHAEKRVGAIFGASNSILSSQSRLCKGEHQFPRALRNRCERARAAASSWPEGYPSPSVHLSHRDDDTPTCTLPTSFSATSCVKGSHGKTISNEQRTCDYEILNDYDAGEQRAVSIHSELGMLGRMEKVCPAGSVGGMCQHCCNGRFSSHRLKPRSIVKDCNDDQQRGEGNTCQQLVPRDTSACAHAVESKLKFCPRNLFGYGFWKINYVHNTKGAEACPVGCAESYVYRLPQCPVPFGLDIHASFAGVIGVANSYNMSSCSSDMRESDNASDNWRMQLYTIEDKAYCIMMECYPFGIHQICTMDRTEGIVYIY